MCLVEGHLGYLARSTHLDYADVFINEKSSHHANLPESIGVSNLKIGPCMGGGGVLTNSVGFRKRWLPL